MDLSVAHLIVLLQTYRYEILFPISILEGPIATVAAGFLSTMGQFNAFLVYITVVVADLIGDTFWYGVGRLGEGRLLARHGHRVGVTPARMEEARKYFANNHHKAIAISKLVHGIGFVGLIAAGTLKIPYRRYILTSFVIALGQAAFFLILGILFGGAYVYIDMYLSKWAAVVSIATLAVGAFSVINYFEKAP